MLKKTLLLILLPVLTGYSGPAQSEAGEYNLKAAFIYNFTKYIDWNEQTDSHEFVIGIVGSSPLQPQLAEIARTQRVGEKRIVIHRFEKPEDITWCHILFIPQQAGFPLDAILAKAKEKGMLVISEKQGYAAQGTAINFVILDRKLKFEVNLHAINLAGLTVSSQLLKLAIIVNQS